MAPWGLPSIFRYNQKIKVMTTLTPEQVNRLHAILPHLSSKEFAEFQENLLLQKGHGSHFDFDPSLDDAAAEFMITGLEAIDDFNTRIKHAFQWQPTPQGYEYWQEISYRENPYCF